MSARHRMPKVAAVALLSLCPWVVSAATFHIYPTGLGGGNDFQVLQSAIDAAADGDTIVMMDTLADRVTPAIWTPGGDLTDDFPVYVSRNGVPVGGAQRYSKAWPNGFAAFLGVPVGRGISVNKALTIRGNGVDGNGVPRTLIGGDRSWNFDIFKVQLDATGDPNAAYAAAWSRQHTIVLHHKRSTLQDLKLVNTGATITFAHPGVARNIHADGAALGLTTMIDDRSVYPHLVHGSNLDFSEPERSLFEDCVMTRVNRGIDATSPSGLTVRNCRISGYGAAEGVINLVGASFIPEREGWVDFRMQIMSDVLVENCTVEERNAVLTGADSAILVLLLGSDVLSERVAVRDNTVTDVASNSDSPFARNGIQWIVGQGATSRDSEITNNTIHKAGAPIGLFAYRGATLANAVVANNKLVYTRQVDATHQSSLAEVVVYADDVTAGMIDAVSLTGNDYTASGAPGIRTGGGPFGGTTVLFNLRNSIVHETGRFPHGNGGPENHVSDLLGTNNRIVGGPANTIGHPKGVGKRLQGRSAKALEPG